MRTLGALSAAAILGVAVPAAASGPNAPPPNGIYGHATEGPLTPVCRVGVPCYGPAGSTRLGFKASGRRIRWTRTDAQGDFRLALRPGRYVVKSKIGFGAVKPQAIRIKAGRFVHVELVLDTGIR
jgi:hypothetical protein